MRKKLIWISFQIFYSTLLISQANLSNSNFDYLECGCSGEIDLKIYNGLYSGYGGQLISETDEWTKGALTVANKNNTDGDTDIDYIDPVVTSSTTGRPEVDLMKLVIDHTGIFSTDCDMMRLEISGPVPTAIYTSPIKGTIAPSTYNLADLPKTVYIEAKDHSHSMNDIVIQAIVQSADGDVLFDEVRATAIWVYHVGKYKSRGMIDPMTGLVPTGLPDNPAPSGLGINQVHLINAIDNTYRSIDDSRYGLGTCAQFTSTEDGGFAGRIVHDFEIWPPDLVNHLVSHGIKFDIARRKNVLDKTMSFGGGSLNPSGNVPWPTQIELPNDDGVGDLDEDNIPTATKIFSFDGPGAYHSHIVAPPGRYFSPPNAYFRRNVQFTEFVRVSFDMQPTGDFLMGSVCSSQITWSIDCMLKNDLRPGYSADPYNPSSHVLTLVTTGKSHTQPRILNQPSGVLGNGPISVELLSNPVTCGYYMTYDAPNQNWTLLRRTSTGTVTVNTFNSTTGVWILLDPSKIRITITNNTSQPFANGNTIGIHVLNAPGQIINSLN